jgi:hypothetical protein
LSDEKVVCFFFKLNTPLKYFIFLIPIIIEFKLPIFICSLTYVYITISLKVTRKATQSIQGESTKVVTCHTTDAVAELSHFTVVVAQAGRRLGIILTGRACVARSIA